MPDNLLTEAERASYTGDLYSHFLTFRREFVIYKQQEETFISVESDVYPGYSPNSVNNTVYTTVTGVYSGLKYGPEKQFSHYAPIIHNSFPQNNTYIKVERDCMEFIEKGKTEKIIIDGLNYNVKSDVRPRNYLGLLFYEYEVAKIN